MVRKRSIARTDAPEQEYLTRWSFGNHIHLHKFHSADPDHNFHSHPWYWAVGIVLKGGYVEDRIMWDSRIHTRFLRFLSFNVICGETYHRIPRLLGPTCWTLFITSRRHRGSWGFGSADAITKAFSHRHHWYWRTYLQSRFGIDTSGEPEE